MATAWQVSSVVSLRIIRRDFTQREASVVQTLHFLPYFMP
jgi:hypothetical protein